MTLVGAIDLVTFVAFAAAIIGIVSQWRGGRRRESVLLLLGIAVTALLHSTSNVLEWTGITAQLDPFEDYFQIVEPVLWFFFIYSFLRRNEADDLRESEERYRALYDDLPDAVLLADGDSGVIIGANHAASRLLGRPLNEIVGMNQTDLHPSDAAETSRKMFQTQRLEFEDVGHAEAVPHSVIRSNGERIPVEITSSLVSLLGRPVMQGVFRDISAQWKAAELLRREKEQAQKYLDIAGVVFVVLDQHGNIVLMNEKGLRVLGYTSETELVGRNWFEACIPEDERETVRAIFRQMMAGEIEADKYVENLVLTRDGEKRTIVWHNTVLQDADGTITGTLSSGEDVTEKRRAEKERLEMESQLRQTQKLESIGTLASGVAHEINNPLTGIINYAQLIHDRIEIPKLREYARGIVEEGNRVADIVKSLLSFSRVERESHSPACMSDIVNSTFSLIGAVLEKDHIQLTVEIAPNLPSLECHPQQIQQVLINLLTNARDALNDRYPGFDENKILRVSVTLVEQEEDLWMRTIVEDHGSGIPDDIVERIFDPFFSTKSREKGTGLGLSISYGLVRDHQGQLLVECRPGVYTRFIMDLPVEQRAAAE